MIRHVLLAGGTGLIGGMVSSQITARPNTGLITLVRKGSATSGSAIDYEQLCNAPADILRGVAPDGADTAISCLGTTIRTAGSKPAMFRVDHDYVLAFAQGARTLGVRQFIVVSSAGAGGPGFYLQTKGAIENAIAALGFDRLDVIRPGFLLGKRHEGRPIEAMIQPLFAALNPILIGSLSRYGAIPAQTVAKAIAVLLEANELGHFIHENNDLRHLASARS